MDELVKKSASDLARLIKNGEASSNEVVQAHLTRIKEINPDINAVTNTLEEQALENASKADEASEEEKQRPLHGVPFTIKENIDFLGTPTTNGLPMLVEAYPPKNAPIVDRMINAGAIPLGRTNLPEMGLRLDTDNPLRGRTFNPWNKAITPGGSSGGASSAVAAGIIPMAQASDGGGSIRIPASCCGLFGLKPTRARTPLGPISLEGWGGQSIFHCVSVSVRDSAALLDVTEGPELGSPYRSTHKEKNYLEVLNNEPGNLKIGFFLHDDINQERKLFKEFW